MATHLLRSELLEHPVRETLYDVIRREPGIPFTGLLRRLKAAAGPTGGLGHGNLENHLYRLERFGLITSRRAGRHRRYYQNGGPQGSDATAFAMLQTEPVPALARIILDRPGQCQGEIWQRFCRIRPRSRQVVGYHLDRLRVQGLAAVERRGKRREVRATAKLLRLMPLMSGRAEARQPGYQIGQFESAHWDAASAFRIPPQIETKMDVTA